MEKKWMHPFLYRQVLLNDKKPGECVRLWRRKAGDENVSV